MLEGRRPTGAQTMARRRDGRRSYDESPKDRAETERESRRAGEQNVWHDRISVAGSITSPRAPASEVELCHCSRNGLSMVGVEKTPSHSTLTN